MSWTYDSVDCDELVASTKPAVAVSHSARTYSMNSAALNEQWIISSTASMCSNHFRLYIAQ